MGDPNLKKRGDPMDLKRLKEMRSERGRSEMSGNALRRRTDRCRYELKKGIKNRPLVVFNVILRLERDLILKEYLDARKN